MADGHAGDGAVHLAAIVIVIVTVIAIVIVIVTVPVIVTVTVIVTVHLQALADDGQGDELGLRDLLQHLVVGGLVEHDEVGQLLLDLALGPLLLARLAAGHGGLHLGLLGLLHNLVRPHGDELRADLPVPAQCAAGESHHNAYA